MATHYRTKGYVIKKTDLREADQLFTLYTQDFGKIDILGRAIRKIKSKLRPGAEILNYSEIEFIQGKGYKTLTDAVLINKFKDFKNDDQKARTAFRIAETLDQMIKAPEPDREIWQLLNDSFKKIDSLEIVYHYFLWNLLSLLGYQIDLYHCVACQKELVPLKLYFNPDEGGIVCAQCFDKINKRIDVCPQAVKIIRLLLTKEWEIIKRLKITEPHLNDLDKMGSCFLQKIIV